MLQRVVFNEWDLRQLWTQFRNFCQYEDSSATFTFSYSPITLELIISLSESQTVACETFAHEIHSEPNQVVHDEISKCLAVFRHILRFLSFSL